MSVVHLNRLVAFSSTNGPTAATAAAAGWLALLLLLCFVVSCFEREINLSKNLNSKNLSLKTAEEILNP